MLTLTARVIMMVIDVVLRVEHNYFVFLSLIFSWCLFDVKML